MRSTGFPSLVSPIASLVRRRTNLGHRLHLEEGGSPSAGGEHSDRDGPSAEAGDVDAGIGLGGFAGSPEVGGTPGRISQSMAMEQAGTLGNFGQRVGFDPVSGTFGLQGEVNAPGLAASLLGMALGPIGSIAGSIAGAGLRGMDPTGGYGKGWVDVGGLQGVTGSYGRSTGGEHDRGADWYGTNGGRVRLAMGGAPMNPAARAAMFAAMRQKQAGQPPMGAPQARPQPFRFTHDPAELVRRYGGQTTTTTTPGFADGGSVRSALISGPAGGRSDRTPAELDRNGYVIPASVVSAEGDGNTEAGALRIAHRIGSPAAARKVGTVGGGEVPAMVSSGEMYLEPGDVERAGGHGALDSYVRTAKSRYAKKLRHQSSPRR